ncbi:MAG TPA: FkbM family methyltransferase [Pyrinomonadaceae bacterium]|nr:FkbM family methyltransferase [Pyrinomonadaceae bacterium]
METDQNGMAAVPISSGELVIPASLTKLNVILRLMKHLSNWREVWRPYFSGQSVPPLRFRSGLTLHHTEFDGPIPTMLEIFGDECYGKNLAPVTSGTVVDVGANIGVFSLYWAKRAKEIKIHAYEPSPQTCATLALNIKSNGLSERVTIFGEGVGASCAPGEMWTNVPSLIASSCDNPAPTQSAIPVTVGFVDLNEVVKRSGPVELLKIDTEGAEVGILEAASPDTLKQISQIVLEYHDYLCPSALARCQRLLEAANYRCVVQPDKYKSDRQGLLYAIRN